MPCRPQSARRRDAAVSDVVAPLVLVVITVLGVVALHVYVRGMGMEEAPAMMSLQPHARESAQTHAFLVATAQPGTRWEQLALSLDGAPLAYDATLSGADTYCVVLAGGACEPDAPARQSVLAGQLVRVHDDAPLGGQRLRLADLTSETLVAVQDLRG